MSILTAIKSIFKSKKPESFNISFENHPLKIHNGSLITLSPGLNLMLDGSTEVKAFSGDLAVVATGKIDLGQGVNLHRFYLEDDFYWIQVKTSGYDTFVLDNIILFNYQDVQPISSEAELLRLCGPDSAIGLPTIEGTGFTRAWGSEEGLAEFVPYTERVSNEMEIYSVEHKAMLYERDTDIPQREELLIYSVEEMDGSTGERTVCLTRSIGLTLFETEINII